MLFRGNSRSVTWNLIPGGGCQLVWWHTLYMYLHNYWMDIKRQYFTLHILWLCTAKLNCRFWKTVSFALQNDKSVLCKWVQCKNIRDWGTASTSLVNPFKETKRKMFKQGYRYQWVNISRVNIPCLLPVLHSTCMCTEQWGFKKLPGNLKGICLQSNLVFKATFKSYTIFMLFPCLLSL